MPQVERGIHGLEPSVVTSFPTVKLGDGGGGGAQRPPVQEESQLGYRFPPLSLSLPLLVIDTCAMRNTAHASIFLLHLLAT